MQLLDALAREHQLLVWGLLRLLDERVDHHNAPADEKAVDGAPDSRASSRSELEEATAHGARVRQPQVWPVFHQQLDEASVVGKYVDRPRLNLGEDAGVEVLDLVRHAHMLADTLTQGEGVSDAERLS